MIEVKRPAYRRTLSATYSPYTTVGLKGGWLTVELGSIRLFVSDMNPAKITELANILLDLANQHKITFIAKEGVP